MKFYNRSHVVVSTFHEDGSAVPGPAVEEYRVRSLGRGLWSVEDEDGYRRVLRTAALQRFFRPRCYEDGYYSSGEPVVAYEEVRVDRDTWWRW